MVVTLSEGLQILVIVLGFGALLVRVGRRDKTIENHTKQLAKLNDNVFLTESQHNLICHARQIENEADIKSVKVTVKALKEDVKDLCRKTDAYQQAANKRWEETVKVLAQVCATLEQNRG